MSARALVLDALNTPPRLVGVTVLPPGPGEVRVRIVAAGLCHTDVSAVRDARVTPIVLGHEGAGVVESIGAGVEGFDKGDRVLLCWKPPCGRCRHCVAGEYEHCEKPVDTKQPRVLRDGVPLARLLNTGCFSDYVVVPASAVVHAGSEMPMEEVALVGCAVATGVGAVLRTARVERGATLALWGAGGVGLNVISGARLAGVSLIVAVDPDDKRRDHALTRGATHAVSPEDALAAIQRATAERGVDYAFEIVGDVAVMRQALSALARAGTLVLIGAAPRDAELSFRPRAFMSNQQRIIGSIYGSIRPHFDLPLLLRWGREGVVPLSDLVGERISPDDLPAAFEGAFRKGVRTIVGFS